jgi:hypothetical protein
MRAGGWVTGLWAAMQTLQTIRTIVGESAADFTPIDGLHLMKYLVGRYIQNALQNKHHHNE